MIDHNFSVFFVKAEIEAVNGQIVVVSFGVKEGAHKWIKETKCPYKLYLDPDREVRYPLLM